MGAVKDAIICVVVEVEESIERLESVNAEVLWEADQHRLEHALTNLRDIRDEYIGPDPGLTSAT